MLRFIYSPSKEEKSRSVGKMKTDCRAMTWMSVSIVHTHRYEYERGVRRIWNHGTRRSPMLRRCQLSLFCFSNDRLLQLCAVSTDSPTFVRAHRRVGTRISSGCLLAALFLCSPRAKVMIATIFVAYWIDTKSPINFCSIRWLPSPSR